MNSVASSSWYCEHHTCSHWQCYERSNLAKGSTCTEHAIENTIPPNSPAEQPQLKVEEVQAYYVGYADGIVHSVNLGPQDREDANIVFGKGASHGYPDGDVIRTVMKDMANKMIKNATSKKS